MPTPVASRQAVQAQIAAHEKSGHALAPLYRVCCYVRCRCQAGHTASFLLRKALTTIDECMFWMMHVHCQAISQL